MPRTLVPPKPYNCRHKRPRAAVSVDESFADELSKRVGLHASLDKTLTGVNPPSETGHHVPPSQRLYQSLSFRPGSSAPWNTELEAWRLRWRAATEQDARFALSGMTALAIALEIPLLCRDPEAGFVNDALWALPAAIGREVHKRISDRYLEAYGSHTVACDGRVYLRDGREERLSRLARNDRDSVYGALNFSLAGQRNDIIDIDLGEMWEIKPANLTRRNLLQLWGYVDNYEVARVFCYYEGSQVARVIRPGDPATLPTSVTAAFEVGLGGATIVITPFVNPELPGLIAYTVQGGRKRQNQAEALQAFQALGANLRPVLLTARVRDSEDSLRALEAEAERLAIVCGVGIVLAAVAVVALTAGVGAAVVGGGIAGGSAGIALGAGEASVAVGNVIALNALRTAAPFVVEQMAVQAMRAGAVQVAGESLKIAAGLATVYVAGQEFRVPMDLVPMCLEAGCEAGFTSLPEPPR